MFRGKKKKIVIGVISAGCRGFSLLPRCGRPEDPDIDFEYVAISWL